MSSSLQTIIALGLVAIAALLLARHYLNKRKSPGCGAGCCAVSPEIKKLQTKLRR